MTAADIAQKLYTDTLIAGPMVRGSSHIFRISCLNYGADIVFSPGLVDLSLISSTRKIENDHVMLTSDSNGHESIIFQTCESEKGKLVLQLVSNDSANAIRAYEKLADQVVGVDLNCGCPESFATHRGTGSAISLETAVEVVKGLSRNISNPVSVKFRIFSEDEKSIQFAQAVESAGASAITVHGRVVEQKHQGDVNYEKMKLIFDHVKCCKIGNGGINSIEEAEKMKKETGCSAVMISSAALRNPSVFNAEIRPEIEVLSEMSKVGKQHKLEFRSCKWSLQQVIQAKKSISKSIGEQFNQAKTWEEFDDIILKHI